jgi:hypothetical protein
VTAVPHLGAYIILAGVLLALGFMVAGVLAIVRPAKQLSARLAEAKMLPILVVIDETQRKLDEAQTAAGTLPDLVERARIALADIAEARERLRTSADAIGTAARLFGSLFART